jgi:transcriptional regulator with XRE-family HTH domain
VSYADEVGGRLRELRLERGMSLQDVERRSEGRWKAAVVGSYERGDRTISASRLVALAEFYGVRAVDVLPDAAGGADRSTSGIVLDLERLEQVGDRWGALRRYCAAIQRERGDWGRRVLSLRADDLRAIASVEDLTVDELLTELAAAEVYVSDREA